MTNKTTKLSVIMLFVMLLVSQIMLASGGSETGTQADGAGTKIVFWDENAGPTQTPVYQELISRFTERNPQIDVEYVGIPWESAKQKFDIANMTNTGPDCSAVPQYWLASFVAQNAVLPLDDYFAGWSDRDLISSNHIRSYRDIVADGKLYGLPFTDCTDLIWYRADWFEEAGLAIPQDFDEFFNAIEVLTDRAENRYGFGIRGGNGSTRTLESYLYAYSGLSDYFDENDHCTIAEPAHLEALERFVSIYGTQTQESDVTAGYKEMVAGFDSGITAMILHNVGSFGEHSEALPADAFSGMLFPKAPNGKRPITGGGAAGFSIYSYSEEADAAWELIGYLAGEEGQSYWNMNIGQLPTHLSVMDHDWVQNAQHIQVTLEAFSDPSTVTRMRPLHLPDYDAIHSGLLEPAFQEVLIGKKAVKVFLDEWAAAMNKAQEEYRNQNN